MPDRREFLSLAGVGGGSALLGACAGGAPFVGAVADDDGLDPTARALLGELREIPVDDTHCHPVTFDDAETDPERFIERLALSAFPMDRYFPAGVYERWQAGDAAERAALDAEFDVATTRARVLEQAGETVFLRYLVKELAAFLACAPTFAAVSEARNARGRDYASYLGALFADANIENAMLDMGYREGMDQAGVDRFKDAIAPTRGRHILRVDTIVGGRMGDDLGTATTTGRCRARRCATCTRWRSRRVWSGTCRCSSTPATERLRAGSCATRTRSSWRRWSASSGAG